MYLILNRGAKEVKRWDLSKDKLTVGRDPKCDISIDDPKMSRFHGEFTNTGGSILYIDLNSRNGSYVNNQNVMRRILSVGDELRLGDTVFGLSDSSSASKIVFVEQKPEIEKTVNIKKLFMEINEFADLAKASPLETKIINIEKEEFVKAESLLKNLKIVYDFAKSVFQINEKDRLYKFLENFIFGLFPEAEHLYLFLGDSPDNMQPEFTAIKSEEPEDNTIKISRTIFNKAVVDRSSVLGGDVRHDKRFKKAESVLKINIRSVLVAPLVLKEKLIGVIYLDNRTRANVFRFTDPELLMAIAEIVAIAVDKIEREENLKRSFCELIINLKTSLAQSNSQCDPTVIQSLDDFLTDRTSF